MLEQTKLFKELVGKMTGREIAKRLGVSLRTVTNLAKKHNVSLRIKKHPFEDVENARELSETYGISCAEIARKLEVHEETVRDWLRYKNRAYA